MPNSKHASERQKQGQTKVMTKQKAKKELNIILTRLLKNSSSII